MQKLGKAICKYRKLILIFALLLLIPSILGIKSTKINYDILVYLPDNVEKILSIADIMGTTIPKEMIPDDIKEKIYKGNETIMLVTFKDQISSDTTMKTVENLRKITDEHCKISGMTATVLDISAK